jgi:uncharacterized protein YkwD
MKKNFIVTAFLGVGLLISLGSFSPASGGIDKDVLKYTNAFRKSKGLSDLTDRKDLDAIARKHSEDMASGRVGFGHSGFNQRYDQARRSIQGFNSFGENVAYGVKSGRDVVTLWKRSSDHRHNMLGNYRYVGIGTAKDRRGVIYYTQVFAN